MKIDTTKKPAIPYDGWTVESHDTSLGTINHTDIELHLDSKQETGYIEGNDLRKKLQGKPTLNATVLDWFLKNTKYIPEEWRGKMVFFWGTVYRDADGYLFVRCLCFDGGAWSRDCSWLVSGWGGGRPAALLASSSLHSKSLNSLPFDPLNMDGILELHGKRYKVIEL